jgi:hypothetical protein
MNPGLVGGEDHKIISFEKSLVKTIFTPNLSSFEIPDNRLPNTKYSSKMDFLR